MRAIRCETCGTVGGWGDGGRILDCSHCRPVAPTETEALMRDPLIALVVGFCLAWAMAAAGVLPL